MQNLTQITSPFILILLLVSCSGNKYNIKNNGFDTACHIFKEASEKNLSPEDLGTDIEHKLKSMPEQKAKQDVIELYDMLFQADPALRYKLFKESAEYTLKREWHCSSIRELYHID